MEKHRAKVARENAFIEYRPLLDSSGRLRLAVKDNIDMKGEVTTAGSEYLARNQPPATRDAPCLAIARERNVVIVGKTNMTEFAVTVSGENKHFGTPRNRFDGQHEVIPGGSSSGSAVAVKTGMADVAFGTDTAGSIRVPAACCGVYGLKTTFGLVPIKGVFPISPKYLDTVGPLANDIDHLVQGMELLQRGFAGLYAKARAAKPTARQIKIGRLYLDGTDAAIDKAIDETLAAKHFRVVRLSSEFKKQWEQAQKDGKVVAAVDAWLSDRQYENKNGVSFLTKAVFALGELQYHISYDGALKRRAQWQRTLRETFKDVDIIAVPTLQSLPPKFPFWGSNVLFELKVFDMQNTVGVNYAGNPALALPILLPAHKKAIPATSLQLIGRPRSEAELLNAGRLIESKT
ncbi:amidase [Prosthecobacter sp.]|uniref:amidase n=1 Tax=Prosthecobacter sp. TaxID=1965333 RepID=UPI00248717A9|nr:amidase [Prosthecobacter sp.]MDI1312859.1 amidase [Prosthecobacter sp.]